MSDAKILIAEDEKLVAKYISKKLKDLGYVVSATVSTGEEAIVRAAELSPDLVLMDIMLKGKMDGVECAYQIHNQFNIPIVYLTAYSDKETLERAKRAEPYGYLLKPFEEKEFYTTIEMALYRHNMEKRLKESQQWLFTTLKSIGDAVITTDKAGSISFINPVAEKLTGWSYKDALHRHLNDIFQIENEETGQKIDNPMGKILLDEISSGFANHTLLISKTGNRISIDERAAPIVDEKGNRIGLVLVFHDISDRRRYEKALQYRMNFENLIASISTNFINVASEAVDNAINSALKQLGEYALVDRSYVFWFSQDLSTMTNTHEWCQAGISPQIQNLQEVKIAETLPWFVEKIKKPEIIYFQDISEMPEEAAAEKAFLKSQDIQSIVIVPMIYQGNIFGFLGFDAVKEKRGWDPDLIKALKIIGEIFTNALQRKTAEEALKKSEYYYRILFQQSKDMMFLHYIQPDGWPDRFIEVNAAASQILGYSQEELFQMTPLDLIPSQLKAEKGKSGERGARIVDQILDSKQCLFEVSIQTKSGNIVPIEMNSHLFEINGEKVTLSIGRDISERKKAEINNLQAVHDKEVLIQEIHHRVKNNLQVISCMLDFQSEYCQEPKYLEMFKETQDRIKSMLLIHEKLYQTADMSRVNLGEYIRSLARSLFDSYGIDTAHIHLNIDVADVYLTLNRAIPCGLIINELISNAIKHAFPDNAGEISIELAADPDQYVTLTVRDNGVGFPAEMDFRHTATLGMQLVTMFVEQIDGEVKLCRENGSEFIITFAGQES